MGKFTSTVSKLMNTVISVSLNLIIYALVLLILVRGSFFAYKFGYGIFNDKTGGGNGKFVQVHVDEGISSYDLATVLKEKGIIDNQFAFYVQSKFFSYDIKAGTYEIEQEQSARKVLNILNSGPDKTKEQ